jgi:hypothetical protein
MLFFYFINLVFIVYDAYYLNPIKKKTIRNNMEEIILRPDAKGRVNLGDLAQGVSSYRVNFGENGKLILTPYAEIPFSEKWIFDNKEVLEKVKEQFEKEAYDVVAF